jgi:hypothetical protein
MFIWPITVVQNGGGRCLQMASCREYIARIRSRRRCLLLLTDIGGEADTAALWRWWVHELADGGEDGGDSLIVIGVFVEPSLELRDATC